MNQLLAGVLCVIILAIAFGLPYLLLQNEIKGLRERFRKGMEADDELRRNAARIDAPSPLDSRSVDNLEALHARSRKPWPE